MIAIHFVSSTLISGWLISHCIFQFLSKTDISMHPPQRTMNNKVPRRDEDEINDRVNWSIYHFTPGLTLLCSSQFNCRLSLASDTTHGYFLFVSQVWKLLTINLDKLRVMTMTTFPIPCLWFHSLGCCLSNISFTSFKTANKGMHIHLSNVCPIMSLKVLLINS